MSCVSPILPELIVPQLSRNHYADYSLIVGHVRNFIAERDRSKLGNLWVEMVSRVMLAEKCTLFRMVIHKGSWLVVPYAASVEGEAENRAAGQVLPLRDFPRLERCVAVGGILSEMEGSNNIVVIPATKNGIVPLYCEISRKAGFCTDDTVLVQILLDILQRHIELIDYAETDTLTGLLNRKTFDEHLDRVLADTTASHDVGNGDFHLSRRSHADENATNWLAILDIDHFKHINDTYGHLIGDEVLVLVSRFMQETFRINDRLFRYGGEEFMIVLHASSLETVHGVLERFRKTIEEHLFTIVGHITISIGFTGVGHMDNPTDLIDRADKALYYAKGNGRNRVENFEELYKAGRVEMKQESRAPSIELF